VVLALEEAAAGSGALASGALVSPGVGPLIEHTRRALG